MCRFPQSCSHFACTSSQWTRSRRLSQRWSRRIGSNTPCQFPLSFPFYRFVVLKSSAYGVLYRFLICSGSLFNSISSPFPIILATFEIIVTPSDGAHGDINRSGKDGAGGRLSSRTSFRHVSGKKTNMKSTKPANAAKKYKELRHPNDYNRISINIHLGMFRLRQLRASRMSLTFPSAPPIKGPIAGPSSGIP